MSDDLLTYYNRELAWFNRALATFSESHPKTAGNLRISEDAVEDPHISRLIESVALLNARIQSRLDDDFPRIVAALLEHLYPFYLAPKPSMLLAELQPTHGIDKAVTIDPGFLFETEAVDGVPCRFQTRYPVTLTPLSLQKASLLPRPFSTPGSDSISGASSVLELRFSSSAPDFSLAHAGRDSLAVHIKSDHLAWRLYDLIHKDCVNIFVSSSELDPSPTELGRDSLQALGLSSENHILPDLGETESEYQLLAEYFCYGDKFLFFQINGLLQALHDRTGDFQIYIYLADSDRELENVLSEHSFALHSTPAVNLYELAAEPCKLKKAQAEYQVIPESSAVGDTEVYAINNVSLIEAGTGDEKAVPPYYGFNHEGGEHNTYWHSSRRHTLSDLGKRTATTDVFLALTNLRDELVEDDQHTLAVDCLCSNGDLPSRLPFGGGQPRLSPSEPVKGLRGATSLSPPSPVRRLDLGSSLLWRLLSHLNLNYLSLIGSKNPAEQLREMLRLYDHGADPTIRAQINAIDSLKTRMVSLPISVDGRPVICRGVDIELMFDSAMLEAGSAILFGEVLVRFLSMYVNLNSFVRLSLRIKGRDGIYHRWKPRLGSRAVI